MTRPDARGSATVAIAHTSERHRSPERVLALVREALAHLGGITRFVQPGQTVLIKPNQTVYYSPRRAAPPIRWWWER
jgi:uncharacterized protein (DUF362 family)